MKPLTATYWALFVAAVLGASAPSAQQMQTRGELEVDDGGSAVFTIPLALPPKPGTNDPALNLVYKSQSGNGLFGVGWTLTGLPSITRCAKNIAEEGTRVGVKNDASDLFCLNGEKLRVVSGVYGGDGAQYRTAHDSYARITSFGVAGAGPRWFRVEQKNGQILEFGNTDDSRLDLPAAATTRVWMVNASMDRSANGNATRYTYQKDLALGEQVLVSMQYTNGYLEVEYEPRPSDDPIVMYETGAQLGSTNRRGKTLRVYSEPLVGGVPTRQLFKEYRLTYVQSGATRRSLLKSVTECGAGGVAATCLRPLNLEYLNTRIEDVRFSATGGPGGTSATNIALDLRGNGKQELFRLLVGNPLPGFLVGGGGGGTTVNTFAVWDYNADGLVDIEVDSTHRTAGNSQAVFYSNGNSLANRIALNDHYWCHGDFDGDGRTEAISRELTGSPNNPTLRMGTWSGSTLVNKALSAADRDVIRNVVINALPCDKFDFDGDGRAELLIPYENYLRVYSINPSGTTANMTFVSSHPWTISNVKRQFGDFNGDGKTDFMSAWATYGYLGLSNGVGFPQSHTTTSQAAASLSNSCVGDFNGDGRSDTFDTTSGDFLLSLSNNFLRVPSGMPGRGNDSLPRMCVDIDGDGKSDVYSPHEGLIWKSLTPGPVDHLSQVDLGAGKSFRIEYKPLTDTTVYTKGTGATYPRVDVQNATYVVSRKLESNGRGGYAPVAYAYSGLRRNLQSNGVLGFETITSLNELSGVAVRTTYRQDYPYVSLPSQVQKYVGAQNLELSTYTYQAFDQTAQYARVHQSAVTTRKWDLNGAFVSWARETDSDFDLYGNPRAKLIENLDAGGVTVVSHQSKATTYLNDPTRWLIGLPQSVTTTGVVSSAPISAAVGTP